MKAAIIHTILLCAVAFTLCLVGKPNQVSASYQQESGQQGQGGASGTDNPSSATKQDATKNETPHWYTSPEWILAIVGSFTFVVIGWQAWETRRSADAASEAAKAALLNAQAVINSERAWIDGEIIHRQQVGINCSALNVSNHGKTPAKLLAYEIRWGYLPEGVPFSSQPLDRKTTETVNRLIGSNDPYRVGDWFRIDKMFEESPCTSDMDTGVLCITISYEDVIANQGKRELHKTTFVYYRRPLLDSLERQSEYDDYS